MTDNELLTARADDCIRGCKDNYLITNTNFLDIYQQSTVIEHLRRKNDVRYELYGGFDDCERKVAVFFPDYADGTDYIKENPDLSPIVALNIKKDNFSTLFHRDYLGAVMGSLNSRRGQVQSTDSVAGGATQVTAMVPLSEMFGYATTLRSST